MKLATQKIFVEYLNCCTRMVNPDWDHTEAYAFTSFVTYSLSTCFLLYLCARHCLLETGWLQSHAHAMGDCSYSFYCFAEAKFKGLSDPPFDTETLNGTQAKVVFYGTFASCLLFLVYCHNIVFIYLSKDGFKLLPFRVCHYGVCVNAIAYTTAKISMYSVLVARLHLAFSETAYAYSKTLLRALYAVLGVYVLLALIIILLFIRGEPGVYYQSTKNDNESDIVNECNVNAPVWFFAIAFVSDSVFTVTAVILFTTALRKAIADFNCNAEQRKDAQYNELNADLFLLPLKYTVLTSVAVMSTMLALVTIAVTNATFLLGVDAVVNCVALLFMNKKWKAMSAQFCAPLMRCVAKMPCLGFDELNELELIEVMAETQRKLSAAVSVPKKHSCDNGTRVRANSEPALRK